MASSLPPLRRVLLVGAALAVLVVGAVVFVARDGDGGHGGGGSPRPDPGLADAAYERLLPGLCDANARVQQRDVAGAQSVFMDQAHQPLHILAADVTATDRAVGARLLSAKAAVERDFDQASAPRLAQHLPPLLEAARAALARLGRSVPDPCR